MASSDRFEQVWGRVVRIASFSVGTAIMVFETVADKSDRPWLYAAAIGMMGLPIARAADSVLGRITGTQGAGGLSRESRRQREDDLATREREQRRHDLEQELRDLDRKDRL